MSSRHVLSFLFFCLFVRPFVCLSVFFFHVASFPRMVPNYETTLLIAKGGSLIAKNCGKNQIAKQIGEIVSLASCKAAYVNPLSFLCFLFCSFLLLFFVFSCYLALYLAIAVKPSSFLASSIHPFTHKATPSCTLPFIKDVVCPSTGGSQRQGEQLPSGIF